MSELADLLLKSSDRHLDASMRPLVQKWDAEPTALQILEVLDHCIHGALADGFIVGALQITYDLALKREGKTHEEMVPLATWRSHDGSPLKGDGT